MNDLQYCFERISIQWKLVGVAPELRQRTVERPSGTMGLEYQRKVHADGHEARFMKLVGPKVDVQTLFIYPIAASLLPVFAAETVVIGGKPQVMVLDVPVLTVSMDQQLVVGAAMRSLATEFGLVSDAVAPEWYQHCRSGHDIFLRQPELAIAQAFDDFALAASLKWLDGAETWVLTHDVNFHEKAIFNYKQHHKEFSPGLPLMSRCFGSAWTEDFMAEFFG